MGQEIECTLRFRRKTLTGKALLETDFVLFRGEERLKVPFRDLTAVQADGGVLELQFPGGPAALELGPAAGKWARKILNPPSRLDKLGVKPGLSVRLVGRFAPDFLAELQARAVSSKAPHDLIVYAAEAARDLSRIPRLASAMKPDGGLWIVYPKGVTVIRQIDVLAAGRAAGLTDVKVAAFSATHTALKFVAPLSAR